MKSAEAIFPLSVLIFLLITAGCDHTQKNDPAVNPQESLSMAEKVLPGDSSDPEKWKQVYLGELQKKDTTAAVEALRRYTAMVPGNSSAWLDLAWLLADRGDPATLGLTDSLATVPDPEISTRAGYIRGVYHSNIGLDDQAIRIFDSIITSNYTFIDAYIEKGIILHDQKKYPEALKTFQQALRINTKNPELYYWISRCYEGMGNGR